MELRSNVVSWQRAALVMGATLLSTTLAHADLGFWSKALIGTWRHPANGDIYQFNSNATYTFTAGKSTASRTGILAYTGYWKIAQPTESESGGSMEGPVALVIKTRNRVVRRHGKRVTYATPRTARVVVDVAYKGDHDIDSSHYYISRTKWRRVN